MRNPGRRSVVSLAAAILLAPTLVVQSPAAWAQYTGWDQCIINGGNRECTFPEKSKWKYSFGPFVTSVPYQPAYCQDIRFDQLSADTPNDMYDQLAAMYTPDRVDACLIDVQVPIVRQEDCNSKPESVGVFDFTLSPYADQHKLFNQLVIQLPNCSMPWYYQDGTPIGPSRPAWREFTCKTGSPAVNAAGKPFCLGPVVEDLPKSEEEGPPQADKCEGNPIDVASGNKYQREVDYERGARSLVLARHYSSHVIAAGSFGRNWAMDYDSRLSIAVGTVTTTVAALRANGSAVAFKASGADFLPITTNAAYNLSALRDASGTIIGWVLRDKGAGNLETYDVQGRLLSIVSLDNYVRTISYNTGGYASNVTDSFGRQLTFTYGASNDPSGIKDSRSVAQVTDPAGNSIIYRYDSFSSMSPSGLSAVTYQDASVRGYVYDTVSGAPTDRLLGVVDELNVRFSTFGYDSNGEAVSTEHAGGTQAVSVVRTATGGSGVSAQTTVAGVTTTRQYDSINGRLRLTSQAQPAGAGCSASSKSIAYDGQANPVQVDGFNGERSCSNFDLSRNLRTVAVRGLDANGMCGSALVSGSALPAGSAKTSTQWHPDWDLATAVAAPGRITRYVYNGQPDPSNGGASASCAPATTLLPDGKPIAVLCKVIEQATTDTNGSLDFSAALDTSVPQRVTSYTYNADGQVLTVTDPRNAQTSYAYYPTTTASSSKGDLQSITLPNTAKQMFDSYNRHGDLLHSTSPNGLATDLTYNTRGRLTQSNVGGEVTTLTVDPAGLMRKIAMPNGYEVNMGYDDAHRLTSLTDKNGNSVTYTLDSAGNRLTETYKDPIGTLKRFVQRTIDGLNRVFRVQGAAQ